MKLDLMKISNIKSINHLKKYTIKTPIFFNNYLFHYLILTNNLTGLKLKNYPIFELNDESLNGFHLSAKMNNYKILTYLIKKYPEFIYNKNDINENFMHYLQPNDTQYLKLIKKYKLDWNYLFTSYNMDLVSPLDYLFLNGDYKLIDNILNIVKCDFDNFEDDPVYFKLFLNEELNEKNILLLLKKIYKQNKNIFKFTDKNGYNILYPIVINNKIKILKYISQLENHKLLLDLYSPINTDHIFKIAYGRGNTTGNFKMANYILDNIINTHDFNESDMNGDNLAHYILNYRVTKKFGNYDIESKILSKYKYWDMKNVNKETPIDYIVKLDYEKYSKFLKGNKINKDYNIKNITNNSWKKLIDKLEKYKNNNQVNMKQYAYSHSNMFQARFTDIGIFMKYLNKKYKNLYVPKNKEKIDVIIYNNTIEYPDNLLKKYNNFAWIIVWNDKNNYYIHPHLNKLINENKKKYDYAICALSLRLPNDGLHAAMILYDFKNNIVERFEPYGNTNYLDKEIDDVLSKELTWNTDLKYYVPGRYLPVAGFQTLSDENNLLNQKLGDFGGYCLAWSLWYVEHRLNNSDVQPKTLVRKTINRFNGMMLKPNEYIRNYANYVNKYRVKWLKDIGIPENIVSNEHISLKYINLINQALIKENETK
jgi:hypothetical protein